MIEQVKIVYNEAAGYFTTENGGPINLLLPEPHDAVDEELINSYDFLDLNWFHYYATFDANEEFRFEVKGSHLIEIVNVDALELPVPEFFIPCDHPLATRFLVMKPIIVRPEGAPVVNRRRLSELQCNLATKTPSFREAIREAIERDQPPADPNDAIQFDV